MILDITTLPPGTQACRHFPPGSDTFDWSVNVTVVGDVLELRNFNPGSAHVVPGLQQWREAARIYFPAAKLVRFERRNRGRSRWVTMRINP